MSRTSNKLDPYRHPQHPLYIVDLDSERSQGYCEHCFGYQEDIGILQDKLMETHNKLIKQIDICREQEEQIMNLVREKDENSISFDIRLKQKQEEEFHNIEELIEEKTSVLRHDLEAMRTKVLSEINKSNKLREENKEIEFRYEKSVKEVNDKVKRLEVLRNKLMQENERLMIEIEDIRDKGKPSERCVCGFEQKYDELDVVFTKQRSVANQLIEENNRLQKQIEKLEEEMTVNAEYIKRKEEIRTEPRKKKMEKMRYEFEETKNLIKKMEQAENTMRARNY